MSPRHDFYQVRAQSELSRIVTVAEAHVARSITYLFETQTRNAGSFVKAVSTVVHEQSENTWESRRAALLNYFDIAIADCQGYAGLDRAILARNVIAHGAGSLTRRQQNAKDRQKLRTLGAKLVGDTMFLTDAALGNCLLSAVELIEDLDKRLPR